MGNGHTGIFSFPFRIYAAEELDGAEVEGGAERFRVHRPTTLDRGNSTLSPDFPPELWPLFRWSPWAGKKKRLFPPTIGIPQATFGERVYDGFRLDYWGSGGDRRLNEFVTAFLSWLRVRSGQEWIGRYESHTDVTRRYTFGIDHQGRAVDNPYVYGRAYTGHPWTEGVSCELWADAAKKALASQRAPEYWGVFHDGVLAVGIGDVRAAVLALTLSLEMARDILLLKYAKTKDHPILGTMMGAPFDDTDLLKHLTIRLEEVHPNGANGERALGEYWLGIREVYIARHHVAHGKRPIVPRNDQLLELEVEHMNGIMEAVRVGILWLESL